MHVPFLPSGEFSDQGDLRRPRCERAEGDSFGFGVRAEELVSIKYFSGIKSIKIHKVSSQDTMYLQTDSGCFFV